MSGTRRVLAYEWVPADEQPEGMEPLLEPVVTPLDEGTHLTETPTRSNGNGHHGHPRGVPVLVLTLDDAAD